MPLAWRNAYAQHRRTECPAGKAFAVFGAHSMLDALKILKTDEKTEKLAGQIAEADDDKPIFVDCANVEMNGKSVAVYRGWI